MKLIRVTLLVLLGLTALIQLLEGIASIVDPAGMMAGLKLAMAPGVEVPVTFLGLAMIARAAVTAIALFWTWQGRAEGLFLARFTALTILLSAPVVYVKLHRPEFAIGDLAQGLLLLIPAMLLKQPVSELRGDGEPR
jgi:hypothetical protein